MLILSGLSVGSSQTNLALDILALISRLTDFAVSEIYSGRNYFSITSHFGHVGFLSPTSCLQRQR